MPLGGYFALNSTTVYPSPRESSRVPFGTGVVMSRLIGLSGKNFLTYNIEAFKELRHFFSLTGELYRSDKSEIIAFRNSLPHGLETFLLEDEFLETVTEIKENTSGIDSFRKRFFAWFNMFRIIKYLNHVSSGLFVKHAVTEQAQVLLEIIGKKTDYATPQELLECYRSMERGINYSSF
jgi:hypothetical protein